MIKSTVLIETYWNVNDARQSSIRMESNVLIETYWNVNSEAVEPVAAAYERINRNILECKFVF